MVLVGSLLVSASAASQEALITGTVTDSLTGTAIRGARIEVHELTGSGTRRTESDQLGRFRLSVNEGSFALAVRFVGFSPWERHGLVASDGRPVTVAVRLVGRPAFLSTITVVARDSQSVMDIPAAATLIDVPADGPVILSPASHLNRDPGIAVARKGLHQATFSARGPNAANSAALLVLHDYRLASVPSLRLNVPYLIPATNDDLERIEVTRGPSSVVYGADADRGVVNFITRSPFASPGTTVSLATGERSITQIGLRHASTLGGRVAFKLSAEYFEGSDWHATDPREVRRRDEHSQRAGGEARLDWQPDDHTTMVFSGGLAEAINNVDLTEVGSIQVKHWRYTFGQMRLARDRLFVNLFYNQNDAGDTFQLFTGAPITDNSRTVSAQVQHASPVGDRLDLTYGIDVQRVLPRTGGSIHGRNEDRDNVLLAGLYLSTTTTLSPRLSLVGSLRGDHHNVLDDLAFSPRVGLVYKPAESHAVRLTYNRATSTPVANDLFADIRVMDNVGGLPYALQARGTAEPYTFRRDCGNGLCMRSPFAGDPRMFLPLDATLLWPWVVGYLQSKGYDLSSIPAPASQDIATNLGVLNARTGAFDPVRQSDILDIPAAKRSFNSTFEAGYRGYIGSRLAVTLDVYHSRLTNVINPTSIQTPNAFLDRSTLEAYLTGFVSPQDAALIADSVSLIPLGIVNPEQADSTELIALGRQGARVNFWGADLGLSLDLNPRFVLSGSLSWASKDRVPSADGFTDVVFNSPRTRGSLGLEYRNSPDGFAAEVRGRSVSSFPVASGEFQGRVDPYTVIDLSASYHLPWAATFTLTLSVDNVLDERHREFAGAPVLGRLVLGRVKADF